MVRQQSTSFGTLGPSGFWIFGNWQGFDESKAFIYLGTIGPNSTVPILNASPVPFDMRYYFREIDFTPYVQDDLEGIPQADREPGRALGIHQQPRGCRGNTILRDYQPPNFDRL